MFGGIGMQEMMIIGIIAVILFGKKLPEVARSVGGSYREFRKGLFDLQSTLDKPVDRPGSSRRRKSVSTDEYDDLERATAPKFELPTAEPKQSEPS